MNGAKAVAEERAMKKIKFFKQLRIFILVVVALLWANFWEYFDIEGIAKGVFIWGVILGIKYVRLFGTKQIERWMGNDWQEDVAKKSYQEEDLSTIAEKFDLSEMKRQHEQKKKKQYQAPARPDNWDERELV